jgi:hypothetical protein
LNAACSKTQRVREEEKKNVGLFRFFVDQTTQRSLARSAKHSQPSTEQLASWAHRQ